MKTKTKPAWRAMLLAALLLAALLTGCGGQSQSQNQTAVVDYGYDIAPAAPAEAEAEADAAMAGGSAITLPEDGRKISLTAWLSLEALDFDATCDALQREAIALGGYIAGTDVYNGNEGGSRYASFTIKVPSDKYGAFLDSAAQAGNLLSRSETSEDLTEQYVDVDARLKSLRTQEERLLEMMGEAQQLSDLILIQEQLSNVQYEIESYTTQQRYLDNRIDYSTVYASVQEVARITEVQDSYWSRITAAFGEGWRAAGQALQQLGIWLVRLLPLILLAAVVLVIVLVVRRKLRKKRAEPPPKKPDTYPPQAAPYPGQPCPGQPYPGAPYSPYPPYPVPRVGPAQPGAEAPTDPTDDPEKD